MRHRWEKVEQPSKRDPLEWRCTREPCRWRKMLIKDTFTERYVSEYFREYADKRKTRAPLCEGRDERQLTIFDEGKDREP